MEQGQKWIVKAVIEGETKNKRKITNCRYVTPEWNRLGVRILTGTMLSSIWTSGIRSESAVGHFHLGMLFLKKSINWTDCQHIIQHQE